MYNPPHFAVPDAQALHDFIRRNVFATFAAGIGGAVQIAYAPVVFDVNSGPSGGVRFHLARANPLADIQDGALLKLSIMSAHAYISPDWYETPDMVPTWNYLAVEGSGYVRPLSDAGLRKLLNDLTLQEERLLTPKPPWNLARLSEGRLNQLLPAIVGFELVFDSLEGKAKLSQNRAQADIAGAIAGLEKRGDSASLAVAAAMRKSSLQ